MCKKKILLCLLVTALIIFTGCESKNSSIDADNSIIKPSPNVTTKPKSEQSPKIEYSYTEDPQIPIMDVKMAESLTTFMYETYGGLGNEISATSWFKYIDRWEVYQINGSYFGKVYLNERPFDYLAHLILGQYYTNEQLDLLCPILMNVGAALNLDDIEICLVGENLYMMSASKAEKVHYYSLASLNIPIYDFLSEGFGASIHDVKDAINNNTFPSTEAYKCLLDYMAHTYDNMFDGLSMEKVKWMSMAAIANFKDVRLETLEVFDHDNKFINKYEKLN